MNDFVANLTKIANDDFTGMTLTEARNQRDKIIEQMFFKLRLADKFLLACVLERWHLTRRIEEKYPGKFNVDDMALQVDIVVRRMREREALSGTKRKLPFTSHAGGGDEPDIRP